MELQKRLDYGFNGYQVPPTPRATRSVRKRSSFRKNVDDNQMCAFDLLATVAGKLLLEGNCSLSSGDTLSGQQFFSVGKDSIKKEQLDGDNLSNLEAGDQRRCDRSFSVSEFVSEASTSHQDSLKEFSHAHNDNFQKLGSVTTAFDCSEKVGSDERLVSGKNEIQLEDSAGHQRFSNCTLEEQNIGKTRVESLKTRNAPNTKIDICSLEDLAARDRKPRVLVDADNSIKLPLCTDHRQADVKLVIRDDDEHSSGCTQSRTMRKVLRRPPYIGDRRMRKLLSSKYWKPTPKLEHEEQFNADTEINPVHHSKKISIRRQRSQRDYPFKKRRLSYRSSLTNSDGGVSSEGITSSPRKRFSCDASGSGGTMHEASGNSAHVSVQNSPFYSRNSHVKLTIKSFKVPELFIEIPESATVGSLKRTVMEAVTAILGGELQVGVILQGKKVRDDNKTLEQTGILHDDKLEGLGFSLEPNSSQASPVLCHEDHPFLLPRDTAQPLNRYPAAPSVVHNMPQHRATDPLSDSPSAYFGNFVESDHDSAPSPDMSIDKSPEDSKALVVVPAMNAEALAVVPVRKSKQSESVQRRIRRPFSVAEVEALVQAVEKLGTGRWRDVKLRAFDNAKHRTYVDLKDKWKTLVHTARISPQQRRGEPVPQELLDRVLTAHAYWSQQQAKQHLKHQP